MLVTARPRGRRGARNHVSSFGMLNEVADYQEMLSATFRLPLKSFCTRCPGPSQYDIDRSFYLCIAPKTRAKFDKHYYLQGKNFKGLATRVSKSREGWQCPKCHYALYTTNKYQTIEEYREERCSGKDRS